LRVEAGDHAAVGAPILRRRIGPDVLADPVGDADILKDAHYLMVESDRARQREKLVSAIDNDRMDSALAEQVGGDRADRTKSDYCNVIRDILDFRMGHEFGRCAAPRALLRYWLSDPLLRQECLSR